MFFYEVPSLTALLSVALYLVFLIVLNEVSRINKWTGGVLFIAVPLVLTLFVWPTTSQDPIAPAGWFQWVKTYSCLAGAILGWLIVYFERFQRKWIVAIPPVIFAINILEACARDFEIWGMTHGSIVYTVDKYAILPGEWNLINAIAGVINAICICGFFGIIVSRGKKKDYVWPDQMWFWIIGYDLWNFAYTYNSVSDRSAYCGLALLLACTIPAFFIKRGAYAQHRVRTLAVNMVVTMTLPWFFLSDFAMVHSTNRPEAHMVIAVLALIWNAGMLIYQVHTMVTKKRNPFKQELYTDSERFRSVYLENIDVPAGKEELALENLEAYGYAAAWDEKGRRRTKISPVSQPVE